MKTIVGTAYFEVKIGLVAREIAVAHMIRKNGVRRQIIGKKEFLSFFVQHFTFFTKRTATINNAIIFTLLENGITAST